MKDEQLATDLPWWLHWVEQCPSTNTWAMEAVGLHHGDVVFTRRQTAGRGQYGRTWHSPPGVLTASFVLDRLRVSQLPGLSLAAGLAVIHAIEDVLPDQRGRLRLKWANDAIARGCKLAGVLCEATSVSSSKHTRAVVGVGLNRCVNFARVGLTAAQIGNAISLHQLSASVPEELVLLERLRYYLVQVAEIFAITDESVAGLTAFLPELRDRDLLLNRPITLSVAGESFSGHSAGIDSVGRLLLKFPTGEVRAFAAGRVVDWGMANG